MPSAYKTRRIALVADNRQVSAVKTILVADDSASMRLAVRILLEGRNAELSVHDAVDGVDAIETARALKPDLILLDLAMPRVNGAEAAVVLKNALPTTPIILFTLNTDLNIQSLSSAVGFDAFISKDGGIPELLETFDALCPPPQGPPS
jgi:CheY-like chemotaxis protein